MSIGIQHVDDQQRGVALGLDHYLRVLVRALSRLVPAKRLEAAVLREVAEELGNTPAVARSSYVDPRVITGYRNGLTIAAAARRADRLRNTGRAQSVREAATRRLIRKVAKS